MIKLPEKPGQATNKTTVTPRSHACRVVLIRDGKFVQNKDAKEIGTGER